MARMKGADQCPKCASRKWLDADQAITGFYARTLRVCGNCRTAWEPFEEADLLDAGERYSSFKEPCNNCAFRPGSNEQQDLAKWKELIDKLKCGGRFYCHKGIPVDIHHTSPTDSGFCYPTRTVTTKLEGRAISQDLPDAKRLRLCRGFLRAWGKLMEAAQREAKAGTLNPLDYGYPEDPRPPEEETA
jgi:hypothetical protein